MVSSTEQPTGNPVMAVPRNYSTKSSQQSLPELAQIQTTTIKMSCDDLSKVSQLQSTSGTSIFDEYSEDKIEKSSVSVSDRRSFFESQRASISNC